MQNRSNSDKQMHQNVFFIMLFQYLLMILKYFFFYLNNNYYSRKIRMSSSLYFLIVVLVLALQTQAQSAFFDLKSKAKNGFTMEHSFCNQNTVIDFNFSPSTTINGCGTAACSVINPQLSKLRFLDIAGSQKTYALQTVQVLQTPTLKLARTQEQGFFKFTFSNDGKNIIVGVPFSNHLSSGNIPKSYEFNLQKESSSAFTAIKAVADTDLSGSNFNLPLSGFNFFNQRDLGHFYHSADSKNPTTTYLVSYFILSNMKKIASFTGFQTFVTPTGPTPVLTDTGDKLCYGSVSEGIFQTHLRESFPLWTAWIGILFYWMYVLLTESNTINCYDKKYQNNKWTCWGFYSLHYLGHEEYFTKLSRTTLMLVTFSWQACVCAILYAQIPPGSGSVMILWAGLIGTVTSMPFTYVMGYVFLRKIYELTLHKYDVLKKMKGVFNKKDGLQTFEKQIDDTEQSLYGYYYWFYVLSFVFFVAFWVIATHEMMTLTRQYYYFMHYWLASIAVAFGFEHLFFDPLLTLLLGNTTFYRIRGFFYDFRLGERFKQVEQ